MSKPLTEVLAHLYVDELLGANGLANGWMRLSDSDKARHMGAMAEVVRTLRLFGWEVFGEDGELGVRRIEKAPHMSREQTDEMEKQLNPMLTQGEIATPTPPRPQFTGRPCDYCQSLNTIQNGKCVMCMECKQTGECG